MKLIFLPVILFMHIFADFHLQGILANMKQYSWWINQEGFNKKYKDDYIIALLIHSFEWSFAIHIPILFYNLEFIDIKYSIIFIMSLMINTFIHAYIDNLKANNHKINLIQDQLIHFGQVILIFILFIGGII